MLRNIPVSNSFKDARDVPDTPVSDFGLTIRNIFLRQSKENNGDFLFENRIAKPKDGQEKYSQVDSSGRKILYVRNASPLLQPLDVLDLYSEAEVGSRGLISAGYPSDHLAISATFQLEWEVAAGASAVDSTGDAYTLQQGGWQWIPWMMSASPSSSDIAAGSKEEPYTQQERDLPKKDNKAL
jgi:hypothetical protein